MQIGVALCEALQLFGIFAAQIHLLDLFEGAEDCVDMRYELLFGVLFLQKIHDAIDEALQFADIACA